MTLLLAVMGLASCAGDMQWRKSGADEAAAMRDEQECRAIARRNAQRSGPMALPPPGMDPRFGAPAGGSQSERLMQAEEELGSCMRERGYNLVPVGK